MPLAPGTRLGPYEILVPIGAGGMGEVYRTSDPRLGRDVALKILPETLANRMLLRATIWKFMPEGSSYALEAGLRPGTRKLAG